MRTIKIQTTTFNLKPESVHAIEAKLSKPYRAGRPKGVKRIFPSTSSALSSTRNYVTAYLSLNNLNYRGDVDHEYSLNSTPTTWPTGEDTYEEVTE